MVRHWALLVGVGVLLTILGIFLPVLMSTLQIPTSPQTKLLVGPLPAPMSGDGSPQFGGVYIPAGTNVTIAVGAPSYYDASYYLTDVYVYNSSGYQAWKNASENGLCAASYCSSLDLKAKVNATEWFISKGDTYYFGLGGYVQNYVSGGTPPIGAFVAYGQIPQHWTINTSVVGAVVSALGIVITALASVAASRSRPKHSSLIR